nr:prostate and testis expressed protein 3 [Chlorocebus sabaeus]
MKKKVSSLEPKDLCLQLLASFSCTRDFRVRMNKYFLFLFPLCCLIVALSQVPTFAWSHTISVLSPAVTSLQCITCHLRTRTDRCRRGFGACTAQKDEACMLLKIYQGNALQISYMVCQKFCRDMTFDLGNRTYVHTCCNQNYCNFQL